MSWRVVVISQTSKLDYKMDYLVIRTNDQVKRVHLSEISVLIIETTAVSLTAYLLVELANRKIDVIFCDHKRLPHGQYIPYYGSHDASKSIRMQMGWSKEIKGLVWKSIVAKKIEGQAAVLKKSDHAKESEKLLSYLPEIEEGDVTNREGHAAKVYFNALFGMDFTRTEKEDVINAELNYGYSILLSTVAREVAANGYLTQIGIHHDNVFNPLNLASDLMEPFRPFVDSLVLRIPHDEFNAERKHELAGFLNRRIIIDDREQYVLNAISIYVKSVFDSMEANEPLIIKYPKYELSLYESSGVL